MVTEKKPVLKEIFSRFDRLDKALIDASSIIYAQKADFFEILNSSIALLTLPEIIAETGLFAGHIELIRYSAESLSTDQKLVSCALQHKLPVISEDRKILLAVKRGDMHFFNSLMMLNYLLFHGKIDNQQFIHYHKALRNFARYSEEVWLYGERIHAAIKKLGQD